MNCILCSVSSINNNDGFGCLWIFPGLFWSLGPTAKPLASRKSEPWVGPEKWHLTSSTATVTLVAVSRGPYMKQPRSVLSCVRLRSKYHFVQRPSWVQTFHSLERHWLNPGVSNLHSRLKVLVCLHSRRKPDAAVCERKTVKHLPY